MGLPGPGSPKILLHSSFLSLPLLFVWHCLVNRCDQQQGNTQCPCCRSGLRREPTMKRWHSQLQAGCHEIVLPWHWYPWWASRQLLIGHHALQADGHECRQARDHLFISTVFAEGRVPSWEHPNSSLSWPSVALMEVMQPCKFSWINFEKIRTMFLWTPGNIAGSLQWFRAQSRLSPSHFNKISCPCLDVVGKSQECFPSQAKFRWTESAPHGSQLCESFYTQWQWLPKNIKLQSPRFGS